MSTVILVANGELSGGFEMERRLLAGWPLIAVDGGLNHCRALGILPDLIVGDFDSAEPAVLRAYTGVERLQFPTEKNETDLQLALGIAVGRFRPERIYVYGALGVRTDHLLANLSLLSLYPELVYLESDKETIWGLKRDTIIATSPDQLISFFSVGIAAGGVKTAGLQWELSDVTLNNQFYSVSNKAVGASVAVSYQSGALLCVVHK